MVEGAIEAVVSRETRDRAGLNVYANGETIRKEMKVNEPEEAMHVKRSFEAMEAIDQRSRRRGRLRAGEGISLGGGS